ncbi:D-alanyl-D-alanine carboxypeptidase [Candidatus Peregrinibacteria bacterium]|nr:D-alanyl-D-alanine carboxypeptidase [Candidatus Peregrinibacteria bacterium]
MLSTLLFSLFFETIEPSYGTFVQFVPAHISTAAETEKAPRKRGDSLVPVIEAKSIYAIDLKTDTPLLARDIFTRRSIASIGKLITAMVILDRHKLDEKIIVSKNAAEEQGSKMGLKTGEEITVENLLMGMLIASGNDAAKALAEFDSGSEDVFVFKMNEKARSLGLKDTHFSNAKGFDEPENYSTAYDASIFAKAALNYPFIRKTVALKTTTVTSASGKTKHLLESTNELLENPYWKVVGLKTGRTPAAGQSFVALAEGPNGRNILTIVLDSPSRFKETKILIDWILRNYEF